MHYDNGFNPSINIYPKAMLGLREMNACDL